MKCPYCGEIDNKVIDSRLSKDASVSAAAGNVSYVAAALQPTSTLKKFRL